MKFAQTTSALPLIFSLCLSACNNDDLNHIQATAVAQSQSIAATGVAKAVGTAVSKGKDAVGTKVAELKMTAVAGGNSMLATSVAQIQQTAETLFESETATPFPPGSILQPQKTATGFYWPSGTNDLGNYAGWMSSGCLGKQEYSKNEYHIGKDVAAPIGANVFAISSGRVFWVSSKGWSNNDAGAGNLGLLIEHRLADGTAFTAVYGHIKSTLKIGSRVNGGDMIGTVGPWKGGSHLHFGIRPGVSTKAPYGIMVCPSNADGTNTNGFVDPIEWITTRQPGSLPE